jgi:nitrogen-specific signal transduction histidine kinase
VNYVNFHQIYVTLFAIKSAIFTGQNPKYIDMSITTIISAAIPAHHYLPFKRNSVPVKTVGIKTKRNMPDRLLKTLAHEIKNPLANINLSVQLLTAGVKEEEFKMCLDIIDRNVQRISDLVIAGSDFKKSL